MSDKPNNLADDAAVAGPIEDAAAGPPPATTSAGELPGAVPPALSVPVDTAAAAQAAAGGEPADTDPAAVAPADTDSSDRPDDDATGGADVDDADAAVAAKDWYILKVQSNRENSIADALQRRVAIAGLDPHFGQIIVPTEKVTEFKGGKKRVVHRKLYPGYILVEMSITEDTWFLVRETPGIGDFTGAGGKPTPMLPHEVKRIVAKEDDKTDEAPKLKVSFHVGDRVKINEGTFENFEGEVSSFDQASGRVTVMINIFGRSTPVELEYWQIEQL